MAGGAAIDALTSAFVALRLALDSNDAGRILEASRLVHEATESVRAEGQSMADDSLREKMDALMPLIEMARVRVNLASDDVRQRLAMLADRGGGQARAVYGR